MWMPHELATPGFGRPVQSPIFVMSRSPAAPPVILIDMCCVVSTVVTTTSRSLGTVILPAYPGYVTKPVAL